MLSEVISGLSREFLEFPIQLVLAGLSDQLGDDRSGHLRTFTDADGLFRQLSSEVAAGQDSLLVAWGSSAAASLM